VNDADWTSCGEAGEGAWGGRRELNRDRKPWWSKGSDVTLSRNVTPVNGSRAYGNTNARGHQAGSSRPGGRGTR
jgi:hypothetical protein